MLIDVKVPVLAESVAEASLMAWHKHAGEAVKRGDALIDIETDKVTLEVAAPSDGVRLEIIKGDGATVQSDEVIAKIDTGATSATVKSSTLKAPAPPERPIQAAKTAASTAGEARLSPAVRGLLEEHKLDAASVPASGPGGRLTKEDVINYVKQRKAAPQQKPVQKTATAPVRSEPAPKPADIPKRESQLAAEPARTT
ncbi:MAG: biotin/lipoyl-containing protein, partial [Gammaproteobacteria bacterium]